MQHEHLLVCWLCLLLLFSQQVVLVLWEFVSEIFTSHHVR